MPNFIGVKPVQMVTVLEGTGTPSNPYMEVNYIVGEDSFVYGRVVRDWENMDYLKPDAPDLLQK